MCGWSGVEQAMTSLNARAIGQAPQLSYVLLYCVTLYVCCSGVPTIRCARLALGSMASLTELSIDGISPAAIDLPRRCKLHISAQPKDLARCAPFGTSDAYGDRNSCAKGPACSSRPLVGVGLWLIVSITYQADGADIEVASCRTKDISS